LKVEDVTNALANGSIIHGAFSQFQLIGFSWLTPQEGQLTVSVLSVHPEFRDHGLGTAFLQKADTVALEMKLPRTTLAVDPWNGRGVNTYLRHGYKIVDLKEAYFGPDYPQSQRFIMVKELAKEKFPYTESIDFQVDASEDIKYALSLGFVGTRLLRSEYDSRKNMITFER
jgi:ribosomal protein S18 acetylase RimI-like enzyme